MLHWSYSQLSGKNTHNKNHKLLERLESTDSRTKKVKKYLWNHLYKLIIVDLWVFQNKEEKPTIAAEKITKVEFLGHMLLLLC